MEELLLQYGASTTYVGQRDAAFLDIMGDSNVLAQEDAKVTQPYAKGWSLMMVAQGDRALMRNRGDGSFIIARKGLKEVDMTRIFQDMTGENGLFVIAGKSCLFVMVDTSGGILLKMFWWVGCWVFRDVGRQMILEASTKRAKWFAEDSECVGAFTVDRLKVHHITMAYFDKACEGKMKFCKDIELPIPSAIHGMMPFMTNTYVGVMYYRCLEHRNGLLEEIDLFWTAKSRGGTIVHHICKPIRGIENENVSWIKGNLDEIYVFDKRRLKFNKVDLKRRRCSEVVSIIMPHDKGSVSACIRFEDRSIIVVATEYDQKLRIATFMEDGSRYGRKLDLDNLSPVRFIKHGCLLVTDCSDHHSVIDLPDLFRRKIIG